MVGAQIDHVMIRVEEKHESIRWYEEMLDWIVHEEFNADTFDVFFIGPADADEETPLLELTYNHPAEDGVKTYDKGDSWGHIGIVVGDLYEAYEQLLERGVADYRDPDSCGGHWAFIRDPDGHEIQLYERDFDIDPFD